MDELALIARAASRLAADCAARVDEYRGAVEHWPGGEVVVQVHFQTMQIPGGYRVECALVAAGKRTVAAIYDFADDEPTFDVRVKSSHDLPDGVSAGVIDSASGAPVREIVDVVALHLAAAQPGQRVEIEARRL